MNVTGTFGLAEDGVESAATWNQTPQNQPEAGSVNGESQEVSKPDVVSPAHNQPQETVPPLFIGMKESRRAGYPAQQLSLQL